MENYFRGLEKAFKALVITGKNGKAVPLGGVIPKVTGLIRDSAKKGNKLIFIGNGGSASIASHMVTDCLKNLNLAAIAFNDASLITCISNDLGYEYVFRKPVELLARKGDIIFAISSSGASRNIINAVLGARKKGCFVITLSGFSKSNPLRKLGDINFYLSSDSYGYVEIAHLAVLHCIADRLMGGR